MPALVIESFQHGLDLRKNDLIMPPGSLEVGSNVFINEGGGCEKRKAFVRSANFFPAGCYGLCVTDAGLTTFGSIAAPANMPAGVTYQQLLHPTQWKVANPGVVRGGVPVWNMFPYDATKHLMSAVLVAENFNGKAFVAARFADGGVYLYYNGTPIGASFVGRLFAHTYGDGAGASAAQKAITSAVIAFIWACQDLGWPVDFFKNIDGADFVDAAGRAFMGTTYTTPTNIHAAEAAITPSAAGRNGYFLDSDFDNPGTAAASASVVYQVAGSAGQVFKINITIPGPVTFNPYSETLADTIPWATDNATTVQTICDKINAHSFWKGTGVTAQPVDGSAPGVKDAVAIYAPPGSAGNGWSASTTGSTVTLTPLGLSASVAPAYVSYTLPALPAASTDQTQAKQNKTAWDTMVRERWHSTPPVTVSVFKGTPPFTYQWEEASPGSAGQVTVGVDQPIKPALAVLADGRAVMAISKSPTAIFKALLTGRGQIKQASFVCKVTDSSAGPATATTNPVQVLITWLLP